MLPPCIGGASTVGAHRPQSLTVLSAPAGKNLSVGKLCTLTASTSLAVESILAITIFSWSLYISPSLSQMGANCLQWPHHGASERRQA